jgi:hypothetical protein
MFEDDKNKMIPAESNVVVDVGWALKEWEAYQEITEKLLNEKDYQSIGRTKFKKKSAWRKYMKAFRISTRVVEKEIIKDDNGRVIEASFLVRAWMPDGREVEGWGNCSKFERGFTKPNHDIPATAMTRAVNRAVSDLIGAGEVSAEEMEGGNSTNTKTITYDREPPKADKLIQEDGSELQIPPKPSFDLEQASEKNSFIKQISIQFQLDGTEPNKQNILKKAGLMLDDPNETFDSNDFRKLKKALGMRVN